MIVDQFLIGALIAIILAGAMLFLLLQLQTMRTNQHLLREEKKILEGRIKNLESKIEFLNTGSLGIGQRLMNTEKKLNQALEKQEVSQQTSSDMLFRRQADRVLQGRSVPETDSTSPTQSEAKLMALVSSNQPGKN